MVLIQADRLSLEIGDRMILSDISFRLAEGEKMGIVGVNGAGKSTLLHLIDGTMTPTGGTLAVAHGKTVSILKQNDALDSERCVLEEMLRAFSALTEMEQRLARMEEQMRAADVQNGPEQLSRLAASYAALSEQYREAGGLTYQSRTRSMLQHMGFDQACWDMPVSALSGGQKTRLALVRLLLTEPDILLLDEPTNHLDTDSLEWLENYLHSYRKALLVISHDRYFLDQTVSGILHIEYGIGKTYNGNYSAFVSQMEKDREIAEKHYQNQQKEIRRIEEYIAQQKRWNRERNIIAAESRQKALDRMEKLEKPKDAPAGIQFQFTVGANSGNDVLYLDNLSMAYGAKPLFEALSAVVKRGERLFVCGPNGCGKSTLLKIIAQKIQPDSGEVIWGSRVKVGYYDQEQQQLHDSDTVLQALWDGYEEISQTKIRSVLAQFRFFAQDMEKTVRVLSGGEKARLALARLVLSDCNLLILDEPTNHLDIPAREALEQALESFTGTILAVSHDRYFIRRLATRIFDLSDTKMRDYPLGYDAYRQATAAVLSGAQTQITPAQPASVQKQQYLQNKQNAAQRRKTERRLEKNRARAAELEEQIAQVDRKSQDEAISSDYIALSALAEEKEALEEALLALYEEEEALTAALAEERSEG